MKKVLLVLLLAGSALYAQDCKVVFGDKEYIAASANYDPYTSLKDGGFDYGLEVEHVRCATYLKISGRYFRGVDGGYMDIVGATGANFQLKDNKNWRGYAGVRMGTVFRGFRVSESISYPLYGVEAGVDYNINKRAFVGISASEDWHEDYLFTGFQPRLQLAGRIRLGYKFDLKSK